jgi:arylsulfatase A
MVLMVDHIVGRLTNYDGKDHGHKTNGDLRGQKGDIYDGGHREPVLLMWPHVVPSGTRCDELLSLADLIANRAEVVGAPLPDNSAEHSRSFLPLLYGERPEEPIHEAAIHDALDGMFAVRMGPWKAIIGTGSGGFIEPRRYTPLEGEPEGQLFNIEDDVRETNNLWKSRPDIVQRLHNILDRYQREGRSRR